MGVDILALCLGISLGVGLGVCLVLCIWLVCIVLEKIINKIESLKKKDMQIKVEPETVVDLSNKDK